MRHEIFDKRTQGCNEVKNSMGLLQGPRLMAWTTKSPIRRNHWVPLGCRGHLGSVKIISGHVFMVVIMMTNIELYENSCCFGSKQLEFLWSRPSF